MTDFNEWYRADLFLAESDELEALKRAYKAGFASQSRTLRDEFAGQAMLNIMEAIRVGSYKFAAEESYKMADAMLEARKTTGEDDK